MGQEVGQLAVHRAPLHSSCGRRGEKSSSNSGERSMTLPPEGAERASSRERPRYVLFPFPLSDAGPAFANNFVFHVHFFGGISITNNEALLTRAMTTARPVRRAMNRPCPCVDHHPRTPPLLYDSSSGEGPSSGPARPAHLPVG